MMRTNKTNTNRIKRTLATVLAFTMCLMANLNVFAAETSMRKAVPVDNDVATVENNTTTRTIPVDEDVTITIVENDAALTAQPRSISGYAAMYTDYTAGRLYISASGSASSNGGATIQTTDFGSSSMTIGYTLYRPNGTVAKTFTAKANSEVYVTFSNAATGTYQLLYNLNGNYTGWLRCWVYTK